MGVYAQTDYIKRGPFISTWDTRITNAFYGSNAYQLKLPLRSDGIYAFYVDWGDNTSSYINSWNQAETLHTYTVPGTKTIQIRGLINGFFSSNALFQQSSDARKLLSLTAWGCLNFKSLPSGNPPVSFYSCNLLSLSGLIDKPRLDNADNLNYLFYGCTSISTIPFINSWDMSRIKNISYMLPRGSTTWNDDISNWNVSSVTDMSWLLNGLQAFNKPLSNWERTSPDVSTLANVKTMKGMISYSQTPFDQDIGNWNVSGVTDFSEMFHYNPTFNNGGSNSINNWNTSSATTMSQMFDGENNPITTGFNQPIENWNVSNVTNMQLMFRNRALFNRPIGSWNVSNVTQFYGMLSYCSTFNQPLAGWERSTPGNTSTMSNAVDISNLLAGTSYNYPLTNWNTSSVKYMNGTFAAAQFNQPVNALNTSNVLEMNGTFQGAAVFNQPLDLWDTSKVYDMSNMFKDASIFNQPIGGWNTSRVQSMNSMFQNATKFNQPIDAWNVSAVTGMNRMFMPYNKDIEFNQPLGGWERTSPDVSTLANVTGFSAMFGLLSGATGSSAFKQNIGNWNVSGATGSGFGRFMSGKTTATFSSTYLDNIYNGWITKKLSIYTGTGTFGALTFGGAKYTAAATQGRSLLTRPAIALPIISASDNGSGLIRIGATGHGLVTSNKAFIYDVTGAIGANGLWTITYVTADSLDLQGSVFTSAYISGGLLRTGYGWAITDGGI